MLLKKLYQLWRCNNDIDQKMKEAKQDILEDPEEHVLTTCHKARNTNLREGKKMGYICEHELKRVTEYDLYAKLQSTIAWKNDKFVIMKLNHSANPGEIIFESDSLQAVVDEANKLEKTKN